MGYRVNVVGELDRQRTQSKKMTEQVVNEQQLFLSSGMDKEREALRIAGLNTEIADADRERSREIERAKSESEYGDRVFHVDELKQVCMKYDLRLLKSKRFVGKIDQVVAQKLAEFVEKHKNEIGNHTDDFYIMAPGYAFQLDERKRKPVPVDPVLLYKIPRTNDFVFIHKWGQDFTAWRRLRGMFFESKESMLFMSATAGHLILFALYLAFGNFIPSFWSVVLYPLIFGLLSLSIGLFTVLVWTAWGDAENVFTKDTWNSRDKRRTNY